MNMSVRISRNWNLLKRLQNASHAERKKIIKKAPIDLILSLCEIAYNVIKGRIPLDANQYKNLRSKKRWLHAVAKKSGSRGIKRKRLLCQQGGFLSALLGAAIPFIANLVSSRL